MASVRRKAVVGGGTGSVAAGQYGVVALAAALTAGGIVESAYAGKNVQVDRVARGSVRFEQNGSVLTIRAGDRSIINYRRFDVAGGETVRFVQPSRNSRVLNRINSGSPSRIDGTLQANGIVYFVNPAGVMFGPNSVVNVGQLYAAAGTITDANFLNNVNAFRATGAVVNQGAVSADAVSLIGRSVSNAGTIAAEGGLVTMVAGDDVMLGTRDGHIMVKVGSTAGAAGDATVRGGVTNTGGVSARSTTLAAGDLYSLAIGGAVKSKSVRVEGQGRGKVEVTGTVDASDKSVGGRGGRVVVTGQNVGLTGATVDASGDAGGGTVLVGGDFQGKGTAVRTATNTVVDNGTTIKADAFTSGDGGKVVVWADNRTTYNGSISARGGAVGGNGGNVEVSGKETLAFNGRVDTTAAAGKTGSLLLDPSTLTIVNGAGPGDLDGDLPNTAGAADAGGNTIAEQTLESLAANSNVTLEATGLITLANLPDDKLDLSLNGTGSLTIRSTTGGGVTFVDAGDEIATAGAPITIQAQGVGSLNLGKLTSGGADIRLESAGNTVLGGAVNAGVGDVSISSAGWVGGAGQVTGGTLAVMAGTGIGTPGSPLATAVSNLEAQSTFGGIFVSNTGNLTVGGATSVLATAVGGVRAIADGDVSISASGDLRIVTADEGVYGPADVTLRATAGGDVVTGNYNAAGADAGQVTAGGALTMDAAGDVLLGDATIAGGGGNGFGDVRAGNGLTLTAGGDVVVDVGTFAEASNGNVVVNAGGSFAVAQSGGVTQAHLWNTGFGSISVTAASITTGSGEVPASVRTTVGDVTFSADDMDLGDPLIADVGVVTLQGRTAGRAIDLGNETAGRLSLRDAELAGIVASKLVVGSAAGGDVTVSSDIHGSALPGGWQVLHVRTGGAVASSAGGSIEAGGLAVSAQTGIGSAATPLATVAGRLEASVVDAGNAAGGIFVSNTGDLTVGGVDGSLMGVQVGARGRVELTNAGRLAITDAGETVAAPDGVTVTATGAAADVVTGGGNSGVGGAVVSGNGTVTVVAGRDVLVGSGGYGDIVGGGSVVLNAGRDIVVDQDSYVDARVDGSMVAGDVTASAGRDIRVVDGRIGTAGGDIVLTTGAGGTFTLDLAVGGTEAVLASNDGNITVNADDVVVGPLATFSAGTGEVGIANVTAGRGIALGAGAAGQLSLGQSELSQVIASTVRVGSATAGDITVGADVDGSGQWDVLSLRTAGDVGGAGRITASGLAVRADGDVSLTGANAVGTVAATGGSVAYTSAQTLTVGTVDGLSGIATTGNGNVTVTTDAVTVSQAVNAGTGVVTVANRTAGVAVDVGGADAAGVLGLSTGELNLVTAGAVRIGSATAGPLIVSTEVTAPAGWNVLHLISGNHILSSHAIAVGSLSLEAGDAVSLTGANAVGTVAGVAGWRFRFFNTLDLTVGTVDGVAGVQAGERIYINSAGGLTLAQSVLGASGQLVRLTSGGSVVQTGGRVTGGSLALSATDAALTSATNDVDTLAALTSAGGFAFRDVDGLTVGTADTLTGIASAGDVSLTAGLALNVSGAVTTGGGSFVANVDGQFLGGTAGTIDTRSGAAGGSGGDVTIVATDVAELRAAVDTSGRDNAAGAGGDAGSVSVTATGMFVKQVTAAGGDATAGNGGGGNGGNVTLTATDGANPYIVLNGDVSAAGGVGAGTGVDGVAGDVLFQGEVSLNVDANVTGRGVRFTSFVGTQGSAGSAGLTVDAPAGATFDGAVGGGGTALKHLTVYGPTSVNGVTVTTTQAQWFNGAVTLGNGSTFTGSDVAFMSTVRGAGGASVPLTVNGATTFNGAVGGGGMPLWSVTVNGATTLPGGAVYTVDSQTYNGVVTTGMGGTAILSGSSVTFASHVRGAADGLQDLVILGPATFGGVVGGVGQRFASLQVHGAAAINGGSVMTTGDQQFHGPVTLGADATLSGANVSFGSTVRGATAGGQALTVAASGTTAFSGAVGDGGKALKSLSTTGGGTTAIGGGSVTTTGAQNYGEEVTLWLNTVLTGSAVTFSQDLKGLMDGAQDLTINGGATFGGVVGGGGKRLWNLAVSGATAIDGGSVTTVGTQNYGGAVALGSDTTLTGTDVTLGGTVRAATAGGQALTVAAPGTTTFGGPVGDAGKALKSLSTTGGGTTVISGGSVTTSGVQNYGEPVSLGAGTVLTATDITTPSIAGNGHGLTLSGTGTTTVGPVAGVGLLVSDNGGTTLLNGSVTAASIDVSDAVTLNGGTYAAMAWQAYTGPVTLGADTTMSGTDLTLAAVAGGSHDLTLAGTGSTVLAGASGVGNLVSNAGGTTALAGAVSASGVNITDAVTISGPAVTTTGGQSYSAAVTVAGDTVLSGSTMSFGSTIRGLSDGGQALTITGTGPVTLAGAVGGGSRALKSLTVNGGGATAINGGAVTTAGAQAYANDVTVGADTTFTAGGNLTFAGTVDGAYRLVVNNGAHDTFFKQTLGGTTPLKGVATDAGGTTRLGDATSPIAVNVDGGDVIFGDDVALAADATVRAEHSAKGILFYGGVEGPGRDLTLLASRPAIDEALAGTADYRKLPVSMPVIGFLMPSGSQRVAVRRLRLNAREDGTSVNGTGLPPVVATVVATGDLTVEASDAVTMGRNEKLTGLHDLTISLTRGGGSTATLGDVTAAGDLAVSADHIVLQQRKAGSTAVKGGGSVTFRDDAGVDYVAGGSMTLSYDTLAASDPVDPSTPVFASFTYGGNRHPDVVGFLVTKLSGPFAASNLTFDAANNLYGDMPEGGVSIVNPAVTIAGATHVELPQPGSEPGISASQRAMLMQIGINARELTDLEILDGLDGREIYVQATGGHLDVASGRLYSRVVADVLETYSTFFVQEKAAEDGSVVQVDTRANLREVLTRAADAYAATHGAFDPAGFRSFVETSADHKEALAALNRLRSLLVQVEYLGLTDREMAAVKNELFKEVKPDGVPMEAFVRAVVGPAAAETR